MSIKYFCDVTGQELDLDYCLHENDKLESKHATIFTNGVIQRVGYGGVFDVDFDVYCKEEALKKFPELQEEDFNAEIWG